MERGYYQRPAKGPAPSRFKNPEYCYRWGRSWEKSLQISWSCCGQLNCRNMNALNSFLSACWCWFIDAVILNLLYSYLFFKLSYLIAAALLLLCSRVTSYLYYHRSYRFILLSVLIWSISMYNCIMCLKPNNILLGIESVL